MRRFLAVLLATVLAGFALTACASAPSPSAKPHTGKFKIVASINVWGEVAKQVGGSNVEVTSLISDPNKDPHSYEATARDQLAINNADLVIINGEYYDDFMNKLVSASTNKPKVFYVNEHTCPPNAACVRLTNPHFWFDPFLVGTVANALGAQLETMDASHTGYQKNAIAFAAQCNDLGSELQKLSEITNGYTYFATESIAEYLLQEAKFVNNTPSGFSAAIETETDVPPAVMQESLSMIKNQQVKYLVVNRQTVNPQVQQLIYAARDAEVRAVGFTELLPEGMTYVAWMTANINTLNPGK